MRAESLDQVQHLFSHASLVIAMRLHALILAATTGCPTATLSYDPKVKAAAQLANLPWLDLAHRLDVQAMTHQWTEARKHPSSSTTIQSFAIQRMCIAQCSSNSWKRFINAWFESGSEMRGSGAALFVTGSQSGTRGCIEVQFIALIPADLSTVGNGCIGLGQHAQNSFFSFEKQQLRFPNHSLDCTLQQDLTS